MNTVAADARRTQIAEVREQLGTMVAQFAAVLPKHIPVERFNRVVLTAIQTNPDLLQCERRSLWNACMRAAQDGLLPDGRLGAIVPFNDKKRGPMAVWLVMIAGIRQKVRNSGEIATWDVSAVFENDAFDYQLGDDPHIAHKPTLNNRGRLVAVYSIAVLKTGERSREVMTVDEVEEIRKRSRQPDGIWKTDFVQMALKTVARRHSKVLPMSSDLDDLLRRDDELYDFKSSPPTAPEQPPPKGIGATLDAIADMTAKRTAESEDEDPDQGERDPFLEIVDQGDELDEDEVARVDKAMQSASHQGQDAVATIFRSASPAIRERLADQMERHMLHAADVEQARARATSMTP